MTYKFCRMLAVGVMLVVTGALAQTPQAQNSAKPSDPATPPGQGGTTGTSPGDMGSTGWTGGTGGSHIGTSNQGPTPGSNSDHPPAATGSDPMRPRAPTQPTR